MKKIILLVLLGSYLCGSLVGASSHEDRQISNALNDIVKYEKQFAGKTSVRSNTIKRSLKLLGLTRQRLDGISDQSKPTWKEADQRYTILVKHMNDLLSVGSSKKTTNSSSGSAAAPVTSSSGSTSTTPKQMISQQKVRIVKIKRDVESVIDTIDKAGVKPFQDKKVVQKYQKSLDRFNQSISKYSEFTSVPSVVAASESISKMENMIAFGKQEAAKTLAKLGDVQSRLRTIYDASRKLKVPAQPSIPSKKGEVAKWLSELGHVRQTAIKIHPPLPEIFKIAYLPDTRFTVEQTGVFEISDVGNLDNSLRTIVAKVDESLKKFSANLDLNVKHVEKWLNSQDYSDFSSNQDRLNFISNQGNVDRENVYARERLLLNEAIVFSRQLKTKDLDERVALLKRIESGKKSYLAKLDKALKNARMPKPVSTDPALLEIARKALNTSIQPGYAKVGEIKRLVITSDKVHRANDVSNETFDRINVNSSGNITMTGTSITFHFEWDEFNVVSAEKVGGKHYIFYNSFTYYTEGGRKTPLNRWVVSGRRQGAEIQEESINKD